jgi:RNA polymerase sigma-70 factor, ECF subfamily
MISVELADRAIRGAEEGQRARAVPRGLVATRLAPEADPVELARRAGEGCEESFARLVGQFSGSVFNYLYRITGRHHDAQDLTQETFLKAYRGLRRDQRPRSFQAWILTIARRTALNHFRSARPTEELHPDSQVDHHDPSALAAERDEQGSIWHLARTLKPRQYEVLWLRYAEGLSIEETARVTRLGRIHVRVLLHRARVQLARRLRPDGSALDLPDPDPRPNGRTS